MTKKLPKSYSFTAIHAVLIAVLIVMFVGVELGARMSDAPETLLSAAP